MEYEKEVTEKLWRGRRSGAVSPGCGGGVYARMIQSGRRGHNWKESQKNHNPEISIQKNANIDGGVISFNRWKTQEILVVMKER